MRRSEQRRAIGDLVRSRIRRECAERGDVARLAHKLGFNPSTLSNVLTGRTRIGEDLLEALLLYWGISEEDLAAGEEVHAPKDRYPNRQIAAMFVGAHLPAAAVEHVLEEQLDLAKDPDPYWWLCRMQAVASLMVVDQPAASPRKPRARA